MKPYAKAQTIVLGEKLDRRCKLTESDRTRIRELDAQGDIGMRPLARMFHVSRSLVRLIVNPESAQKNRARIKANWKKYRERRGKEHCARDMRNHRNYKYDLYKRGVIGKNNKENNKCTGLESS